MGVGAGLYMYDVVVKSSRSLSQTTRRQLITALASVTWVKTGRWIKRPGGQIPIGVLQGRSLWLGL